MYSVTLLFVICLPNNRKLNLLWQQIGLLLLLMYVPPDQWKYNCIILLAYINGASAASDYGGYLFVLNFSTPKCKILFLYHVYRAHNITDLFQFLNITHYEQKTVQLMLVSTCNHVSVHLQRCWIMSKQYVLSKLSVCWRIVNFHIRLYIIGAQVYYLCYVGTCRW